MKTLNSFSLRLYACFIILISSFTNYSQVGYSSASFSYNRSNGIITSEQVIVEEYMNYHTHGILLPSGDESISVDMRWGNMNVGMNSEFALLQIGFATEFIDDFSDIAPVNVCLVIDKSGSMSSDGRMLKLKIALTEFVDRLRPVDKLSIVVYDNDASIILPIQNVENKHMIKMIISGISPGGSTNLNSGMLKGYEQLLSCYDDNCSNRLILFTDGLANTGETNSENIIKSSKSFNEKGIDISTIGVGYNVNFDLLRQLAKAGRGMNHFVGLSSDIEKVFIDEVESLLSPIAKNVSLEIISDENLKIDHIYGYSPKLSDNKVFFELDNMNSGLTQIFLLKYDVSELKRTKNAKVKIKLKYYDIRKKKEITVVKSAELFYSNKTENMPFKDQEVKKNYAIAFMAQSLKDMAIAYESKKRLEAETIINNCVLTVNTFYPYLNDKDIKRVFDIVKKYEGLIIKEY